MKYYLIKNKKYTFMIIFFICCFFLFIDKSYAYVYKGFEYATEFTQYEFTGSVADGSLKGITFQLSSPITKSSDFDILAIRFDKFNFYQDNEIVLDNPYLAGDYGTNYLECIQWENANTCKKYKLTTGNTTFPQDLYGTLSNGSFSFYAVAYSSQGWGEPCYFDKTLDGNILCPLKQNPNIDKVIFVVSQDGFSSFHYDIKIDRLKGLWNNESTEIITALSGLQQQQINTVTTIQNFNNYVSNTSTTQAQTNQTTALGSMNSEFGSHLSQMNELTQLTMLPITFINNLLNNTCQPLVWDIPFVNSRVVVPCMSTIYNGYFSTFVSVFSLIMTSLLGYRAFIKLFNAIKGIIDAEDDKLEVVDL